MNTTIETHELEDLKVKYSQDRVEITTELDQLNKQEAAIKDRRIVLYANLNATIGGLNTIEQLLKKARTDKTPPKSFCEGKK